MPAVHMSFEHGQDQQTALQNFEKGITHAQQKFSVWIHRVEWSEDRTSAQLSGTGFSLQLRVDENRVHADGHLPFFPRFLEGPVRKFLAETFSKQPR